MAQLAQAIDKSASICNNFTPPRQLDEMLQMAGLEVGFAQAEKDLFRNALGT